MPFPIQRIQTTYRRLEFLLKKDFVAQIFKKIPLSNSNLSDNLGMRSVLKWLYGHVPR